MALRGFGMGSGDISSAFLQDSSGAVDSQNIFVEVPPEVAEVFRDQWGPATYMEVFPAFYGRTEASPDFSGRMRGRP